MSGHSKWSQIKRAKGVADAKKGQIFGKLGKLISIAAKDGGDPAKNMKLQNVIDAAKAANMPKENIERAIKRATEKGAATLQEITVKALGPGGAGITIEAITDNSNRTIGELKMIFTNHGATMVQWVPDFPMDLDESSKAALLELMNDIDDNEDVKDIHTNANLGN